MINAFVKGTTEHYNAEAVSVVSHFVSYDACLKSENITFVQKDEMIDSMRTH